MLSPRIGAVLPTGAGTWRVSVGRGFRAPSLAELFVSTQAFGFRVIPNPDLAPETAWSFELGNAAALGSRARLDAAVFWTEARRLIEPTFIVIYDSVAHDSVPAIQFRNVSRARWVLIRQSGARACAKSASCLPSSKSRSRRRA